MLPLNQASKTLFLVRHAKSSWKEANCPDQQRPLNNRGRRDAPRLGQQLALWSSHGFPTPQLILSSSAIRARETARLICCQMAEPQPEIVLHDQLYQADCHQLLQAIRRLDDQLQTVMVVGHHPGLPELVSLITNQRLERLPTCGLVVLGTVCQSWGDVGTKPGVLLLIKSPEKT